VYPDGSKTRKSAPLVSARRLTWPLACLAAAARLECTPTPLAPPLHSYGTRGCPSISARSFPYSSFCLSLTACNPPASVPVTLLFYLTHFSYLTLHTSRTLFYTVKWYGNAFYIAQASRWKDCGDFIATRGDGPCAFPASQEWREVLLVIF